MTNPPYFQASREKIKSDDAINNVILDTSIEIQEAMADPNSEYKKTIDALAQLDKDSLRITINALIECIIESDTKEKTEKEKLLEDLLKIAEKKEQEAKQQSEAYLEQQQLIEQQNIAKMQADSVESFTQMITELTTKISSLKTQIATLEAARDPVVLKQEQQKINTQWAAQQNNFADLFVAEMHAMDKKLENLDGTLVDEQKLRDALKMPSPVDIIKHRPDLASGLCDESKSAAKQIETRAKQIDFRMQLNQEFNIIKTTAQTNKDTKEEGIEKTSLAGLKLLKANRKNGKSLAEVFAELDKKLATQNTKLIQDALQKNSTFIQEKITSEQKILHQAQNQLSECEEKKHALENTRRYRP